MKLICFPHYTCGGLLCDILNKTFSPIAKNGGIASIHHAVGKIGDTDTVFENFDIAAFTDHIEKLATTDFIGTHCWPGNLAHERFDKIINITTATERSRIYRWVRAYNLYYLPQWQDLSGIELLDKTRETAKNYIPPFRPVNQQQVYNLEFAEIVELSIELSQLLGEYDTEKHFSRWREINHFLYDSNFWNRPEVKAYYQASYELELEKYYIYE